MRTVPCAKCPLGQSARFRPFDKAELAFVSSFKTGELQVERGATILMENTHSAHLYTVLSGWMFRYKLLEDGRRQILNFVLPGDLIGLQGTLLGEMQHSVEALTPAVLCVFEKERIFELFRSHPGLAYDVTWIAAREERMLDENLLSLGRRTALERAAYLLAYLYDRASGLQLGEGRRGLPLAQSIVADTLGLSMVHTNRTLRVLAKRGMIEWQDRLCRVTDARALAALAGFESGDENRRPFI